MKKKQACQMVAALVSICALVSVISTVNAFEEAAKSGGTYPLSMILLCLVLIVCTVTIWRGVRNMDE